MGYAYAHKPRFWTWGFSFLPTAKLSVCFHLNCAFIGKYHVLERVVQVRTSIVQPLRLVGLSYELAVGASTVGPAQRAPTAQDCSQRNVVPVIGQYLLKLTCCCLVILSHLLLDYGLDSLCHFRRSPRARTSRYRARFLVLHQQLVYSHSRHADTFRAKSLSYGRRFQALVVKDDDPLLHVVAVLTNVCPSSSSIAFSIDRACARRLHRSQSASFSGCIVFVSMARKRYGTETLKRKY